MGEVNGASKSLRGGRPCPQQQRQPAAACPLATSPASAVPPDVWRLIFEHLWFTEDGVLDEASGSRDTASARLVCRAMVEPATTTTLCLRPKSMEAVTHRRFPHLLCLSLSRIQHRACSVSDSDLAQLNSLTTLKSLDLGSCAHVTDVGLGSLAHSLSRLASLDVSCCHRITAAGIAKLGALSSLRHLNLEWSGVGDSGAEQLALALPDLVSLNLSECGLTDQALGILQDMPKLERLDISRNFNLTSAGIERLHVMPSLRWIDLTSCPAISTEAALTLSSCRDAEHRIKVYKWRTTPWHPVAAIRQPEGGYHSSVLLTCS